MKKKLFIGCAFFIALCGVFFFTKPKSQQVHLMIAPHFMLDTQKVDEFYSFIHDKRYISQIPDTIVLISPNHFFRQKGNISTSCKNGQLRYKTDKVSSQKMKNLGCEYDVFKNLGNSSMIFEHGLGVHFKWINKYFPGTDVVPIVVSPKSMDKAGQAISGIKKLKGNILIIASVDFAHYLPEKITYDHDMHTIQTIKSGTGAEIDFLHIDVDCPACLYIVNDIATHCDQKAVFRYRDSSSTIIGKDMGEENTSRVFMYYQ